MEQNGVVRCLDEMGRLVIPRDFRKALRWRVSDPILITPRGKETLLLNKYRELQTLGTIADSLVDAFYGVYQVPVAVCDDHWILASQGFGLHGAQPVSGEVRSIADKLSNMPGSYHKRFSLTDKDSPVAGLAVPILVNDRLSGLVVLGECVLRRDLAAFDKAAELLAKMMSLKFRF